jgi:hypothetical protein
MFMMANDESYNDKIPADKILINCCCYATSIIINDLRTIVLHTDPLSSNCVFAYYTAAYLLKARIVKPEKQPLLGNGCVNSKQYQRKR